jgi:hypothetical protein
MRKILNITVVGILLFLGASGPARAQRSAFATLFCPECWAYRWGGGALDLKGNCAECGKYPVELEARRVSWWWCAKEHFWRETPGKDGKGCSVREDSLAIVVPRSEVIDVWYCPGHQAFRVWRLPVTRQMVCVPCARPAVRTFGSERAWYWCQSDGLWAPAPCPLNPAKGCCTKRSGMLLAQPDSGPIAR